MRRWLHVLILLGVAGVFVLVWLAYSTYSAAIRAERALHATLLTTLVVEKFVQEHGRWPDSWEDLRGVSVPDKGIYSWPRDSDDVESYVEIDFGVSLEELANTEANGFGAVRPIGPVYANYGLFIDSLLETIRESRSEPSPVAQ